MKTTLTILITAALLITSSVIANPGWGGRGDRDCMMQRADAPRCDMHGKRGGPGGRGMHDKGMGMHGGMGVQMLLMHAEELSLTEPQQTKLKDMAESFALERVDLQSDLQKARIQLRTLKAEDDPSQSEIFSAIDNLAAKRAEMQKMTFRHRQAVKDVLTDEQIDMIKDFRKDRMHRRWMGDDDDFDDRPRRGGRNG
jgi:Spy/CpxP family protein refolding chaperone